MSNIFFSANGDILNVNNIEHFSETDMNAVKMAPDSYKLAGNLVLSGAIRATDFIKEDGSLLQSVTVERAALPKNIYFVENRMGVNEEKPQNELDVKGNSRIQGNILIGNEIQDKPESQSTLTFSGAAKEPAVKTKPSIYHKSNIGLGLHSDYAVSVDVNEIGRAHV